MRRLQDKLAHIDAALDGQSEVPGTARPGALTLETIRLKPTALPECNLDQIDSSLELLGKTIAAPVMIAPMTGGVERGGELNRRMARVAEELKIPFGVGSQRVALEVSARASDFKVRDVAPTIPIFANLGAVQLAKGYGADHALRAVEMIEADALFFHLNAMQEVVQDGGDTHWSGLLNKIESVCTQLSRTERVPVFVREVGFGMTAKDTRRLLDAGVSGIDCAGGGGTSWSLIEGRVSKNQKTQRLGQTLASWGLTTPEAILEVRSVDANIPLIASGGVRTGIDVMKLVALGATVAGMASPVLQAAVKSEEHCLEFLETVFLEIRAAMFGTGAENLTVFRSTPRLFSPRSLSPNLFAI